jgi:2-C-methyl-D-erythritol 4-phosphate cytidylyltransferase
MKKHAIIVAAGSGTRMGTIIPKQFLLLNGRPLLFHTLKTFLEAYADLDIILVLPAEYADEGKMLVEDYFDKDRVVITSGGETRFQSVKNGLARVEDESIIFVHDGVRCLLTTALIHRCYEKAKDTGTAVPVIPSKDSIRLVTESGSEAYDRNKVMLVQTPQAFHSKILLPAYQIDYKEQFTDEATVVEAYGIKVSLVEGEENNFKITTPIDLALAENIILERQSIRNS